jgi:very-short-patch-repair endonuclease
VEDAARDAVAKGLTSWPELFATLVSHSRKGRNGCGPLRVVLDEHYGDETESHLERRFLRLVRLAGLPEPAQQLEAFDEHGFIMRIDFAYPELFIAIELDSVAHHLTNQAFELDPIKRNRLEVAGWLVLTFTGRRLRARPTSVCEQLAAAIRARTSFLSSAMGAAEP